MGITSFPTFGFDRSINRPADQRGDGRKTAAERGLAGVEVEPALAFEPEPPPEAAPAFGLALASCGWAARHRAIRRSAAFAAATASS